MSKREAIEGEDFESAKALKFSIEKLREWISNLDPDNPFANADTED